MFKRIAVATVLGLVATTSLASSAFAWGCYAQGNGDVWGRSWHYSTRSGAIERALEECSARGRGCEIVDCDEDR